MPWLWFVGPLVFLLILFFAGLFPTTEERLFRRRVQEWLDEILGPLAIRKGRKKKRKLVQRRVKHTPATFQPLLDEVGEGARVTDVVLVPKLAYVAARAADSRSGSCHVTVVGKLGEKCPSFVVKPVPIVDGKLVPNEGLSFPKDPEFTDLFWVEADAADAKAVRKWLKKSLRRALCEHPDAWLRIDGRNFALTLYGFPTADEIDGLVDVGDALFAAHGADPSASLFGEEAPNPPDEVAEAPEPAPSAVAVQAAVIDVLVYLVAGFMVALTWGAFDSFHPPVLFNSPDVNPTEPWQGGWTTKGFGAFVAAETFLVLAYVIQTYFASHWGTTLGRALSGVKVVQAGGERVDFWRGALLRSQILIVLPLGVAFATAAKPLSGRSFVDALTQTPVIGAAAAALLIGVASVAAAKEGQGFLDRVAKTRMVRTPVWRPAAVQLGIGDEGVDPLVVRRMSRVGIAVFALIFVNVIGHVLELGMWIY